MKAESTIQRIAFFFFTLAVFGLYLMEAAKAIPSLAMIGLVLCGLASWIVRKGKITFDKSYTLLSLGFVILYGIQFLTSDHYSYLWERIRIKLPLIFIPLSLMLLPPFTRKQLTRLALAYIFITVATALFITMKFVLNYEEYMEAIRQSQIVRGPIHHIRFSIMAVMALFLSWYFAFGEHATMGWLRKVLIGCMVFLFVFIHVYSVRSGLLAMYALIFVFIIRSRSGKQQRPFLWLYLLLLAALPFGAYFSSGVIQNKVHATLSDISNYRNNQDNEFNSLGKRFVSYEVAWQVFMESPLTGCGIGDLEEENISRFHAQHPDIKTIIIPHNQFLYLLMGGGLIGVLIFIVGFFGPLFIAHQYRHPILLAQYVILFLSFQTEPMLETQLGVAYSVIFLAFGLLWIRAVDTVHEA